MLLNFLKRKLMKRNLEWSLRKGCDYWFQFLPKFHLKRCAVLSTGLLHLEYLAFPIFFLHIEIVFRFLVYLEFDIIVWSFVIVSIENEMWNLCHCGPQIINISGGAHQLYLRVFTLKLRPSDPECFLILLIQWMTCFGYYRVSSDLDLQLQKHLWEMMPSSDAFAVMIWTILWVGGALSYIIDFWCITAFHFLMTVTNEWRFLSLQA